MGWHVYDVRFNGFEPITGRKSQLARFQVTEDENLGNWEVRVRLLPSLRAALQDEIGDLNDEDLAGSLGAQVVLTMLEHGLEPFEHDVTLDATHYPGSPGHPLLRPDYRHFTVRAEPTLDGRLVPPL
jgi:hypothetical protein